MHFKVHYILASATFAFNSRSMSLALLLLGNSRAACPGQNLLPLPADPGAMGPWPVSSFLIPGGITTRNITMEVFYPAVIGSNTSGKECQYDIRLHMPPKQAHKIPDKDNPNPFYTNCFPGLQMDKVAKYHANTLYFLLYAVTIFM